MILVIINTKTWNIMQFQLQHSSLDLDFPSFSLALLLHVFPSQQICRIFYEHMFCSFLHMIMLAPLIVYYVSIDWKYIYLLSYVLIVNWIRSFTFGYGARNLISATSLQIAVKSPALWPSKQHGHSHAFT